MQANSITFKTIKDGLSASVWQAAGISKSSDIDVRSYLDEDPLETFSVDLDKKRGITVGFTFFEEDSSFILVTIEEIENKGPIQVFCEVCEGPCIHKAAALQLCHDLMGPDAESTYEYYDYHSYEMLREELLNVFHAQEKLFPKSRKDYSIPKGLSFTGIGIKRSLVNKLDNEKVFTSVLKNYREEPFDFNVYPSAKLKPAEWPDIFRYHNGPEKLRAKLYNNQECADIVQIAELFWFHFSDGLSISSREISLHPLRKLVPGFLLPDPEDGVDSKMDWVRGPIYLKSGKVIIKGRKRKKQSERCKAF